MTEELYIMISDAETANAEAKKLATVICCLSADVAKTSALLIDYRNAIIDSEICWREIEAHPDYHYKNREQATANFFK